MHHALNSGWLAAVIAWVLLLPSAAAAQGATRARNIFNGSVSASEAFDRLPGEVRELLPGEDVQLSALSTMLSGTGVFSRNRRTLQLTGNGLVSFRQDPNHNGFEAVSNSASFGAGIRLSQRSNLQLTQTATYSPLYLYQLFPATAALESGKLGAVDPGYRNSQSSYLYGTHVGLNLGSTRGTSLAVTTDYNLTDYLHQQDGREDLKTSGLGASISHTLSRRASVSAGYQFHPTEFGLAGRSTEHRLTFGANYTPALSSTRRATFGVTVTPTLMQIDNPLLDPASPADVTAKEHPLQWEANADYPFRRKWKASVRGCWCVTYLAEAGEPLLSKSAWADVSGGIGSRMSVSGFVGYSHAASVAGTTQTLGTYTGGAEFNYAVSRILSVDTGYVVYQYDASNMIRVAPGFPRTYLQHGVRVGFTLFARPPAR